MQTKSSSTNAFFASFSAARFAACGQPKKCQNSSNALQLLLAQDSACKQGKKIQLVDCHGKEIKQQMRKIKYSKRKDDASGFLLQPCGFTHTNFTQEHAPSPWIYQPKTSKCLKRLVSVIWTKFLIFACKQTNAKDFFTFCKFCCYFRSL